MNRKSWKASLCVFGLVFALAGILAAAQMHAVRNFSNRVVRETLRGSILQAAIFTSSDVSGLDLSDCDLTGARFDNAKCVGTKFFQANCEGVSFRSANLKNANFIKTRINQATVFTGANLNGTIFSQIYDNKLNINNARDYNGLRLSSCTIGNLHVRVMKNATIEATRIGTTDLAGADLRGTTFSGSFLNGARLVNANLSGGKLLGVQMIGADLTGANLDGVTVMSLNNYPANFSDAKIPMRYASLFRGKVDNFEKIKWVN